MHSTGIRFLRVRISIQLFQIASAEIPIVGSARHFGRAPEMVSIRRELCRRACVVQVSSSLLTKMMKGIVNLGEVKKFTHRTIVEKFLALTFEDQREVMLRNVFV